MKMKIGKSGIIKITILVILISILLIMQMVENKLIEDRNRVIEEFYKERSTKYENIN